MPINLTFRNLVLFTLLLFVALPMYAQLRQLEGVVSDKDTSEPIPYATIILKNSENEFLVGTTTNEEGYYTLEYKEGSYSFELSFMGYQTHKSAIILNKNKTQNIKLLADEFTIDEVTIVAETTTVRQLIDKKAIDVGNDILSNGGSAATVLSQLSEVDADENGSISLRGNSNVQVLVNGKPSPLSSSELLIQIPASEIKTIEVITSPSAKYKADGLTGIINILTKKKVRKGITNSNSISYNSLNGFSGSSSLSYGTNKVNYSVGGYYRNHGTDGKRSRERFGSQPYAENSTNKYGGEIYRLNAAIDWFINKSNEFSWSVNFSNNQHSTDTDKTIFETGSPSIFQKNFSSHLHKTLQLNGNYRHIFKNDEDFLEFDVDFAKNNNVLKGFFDPNISILDNLVDNEVLSTNIALDNSVQLSKIVKLESGYLFYKQGLDNKRRLFDDTDIEVAEQLYRTEQTTHALYTQASFDLDKFGIQVGLRSELFNRKAAFITDNKNVDKTFTDLFPSIHLKYTLNDVSTFGFGYNRRTFRPRLYQINPISSQSDEFSFRRGNPDLDSEFSNNIDLTYQFKKGKTSISTTVSFKKVNEMIIENITIDDGVQISSFINGGKSNSYGLEFSLGYKPVKWLRSNFNLNWNYEDLQNFENNFPKDFSRSYQFTFKNDIKINKKLKTNISWRYRGESTDFYEESNPSQRVDIGFNYKVLKDKGSLSLRFTDIFDDYIFKGVEFGDDFRRTYSSKRETRAVHFTLSYNFNEGELKKRKTIQ